MLPVVADEGLVRGFKFYHDGIVQQGIAHRLKLYKLVESFDRHQRSQAYSLGCQLAHQGSDTVITVSSKCYKVWIEIRSKVGTDSHLEQVSLTAVEPVCRLQLVG